MPWTTVCITVSSSNRVHHYVWFPPAATFILPAGLIKGINEVEDMLKYNIAQARLNERGNYGAYHTTSSTCKYHALRTECCCRHLCVTNA